MTVTPEHVTRLIQEVEGLRGGVIRRSPERAERIDRTLARARRLHDAARGTRYEPTLQSCENLLSRLQQTLDGPAAPVRSHPGH